MGTLRGLTIIKLGGSLVTHKDRPLSANLRAIRNLAREIRSVLENEEARRLFLIHGGGSFGHYYAKKYHLSVTPKRISKMGISRTAAAMVSLHSVILNELVKSGVPCKTVLASELLSTTGTFKEESTSYLENLFQSRLLPISFGNVAITRGGSAIVSGDQIALVLAKAFSARQVIFAMDVDGIFSRPDLRGEVIDELNQSSSFEGRQRRYDVTGGITSKIDVGFEIAESGADVFYVNGNKRDRLRSLILGAKGVRSTHIGAMRISM